MHRTRAVATAVMTATLIVAIGCGSGAKPASSSATPVPPSGHGATIAKKKHRRAANWATYHGNLARTGVDTTPPALGSVHRTWTRQLDGPGYGEPLAVGDRVYAATANKTLYAPRAPHRQIAWKRHPRAPG